MDTTKVGDIIAIEGKNKYVYGEVKFISKNRKRMKLENVRDMGTNEEFDGSMLFFASDIRSIHTIKSEHKKCDFGEDHEKEGESQNTYEDEESIGEKESSRQISNIRELTNFEINHIQNMIDNAEYIVQTDHHYHSALQDIRRQSVIALNVEGCQTGRNISTSILTICTGNNVYIFDVQLMGKVFYDMKATLEAELPKKIIYDSPPILDNLKNKQNVELLPVFDLLRAHVLISHDKKYIDLKECITRYIRISAEYFDDETDVNWVRRPFDEKRKSITVKKTIFIYQLYKTLLHEHMLRSFYEGCHKFSRKYSDNKDAVDVALQLSKGKNSLVNDVNDTELEVVNSIMDLSD